MDELQYKDKEEFYKLHHEIGEFNLNEFYKVVDGLGLQGKKLLDVGCGEGLDLLHFREKGPEIYGIDINPEAVKIAQEKLSLTDENITEARVEKMPFVDNTFDVVASQYVFQAFNDIESAYKEVTRVLKKDGYFVFLATHPFRQYFEKKNPQADYFTTEVVNSVILNATVTVQEPTHTFNEYFSDFFLSNYKLVKFTEMHDPTAEKVEGRTYPGFFIIVAQKIS